MGTLSARLRSCAGVATLWIAAAPVVAADGAGLLASPSISETLAARPDITLVDYRPPCYCLPCPGSPQGVAPAAPGEAVPQVDMMPRGDGLQAEQFVAGLGADSWNINSVPGGYLDNPIVGTWFRARYDVAVNNTVPDLAEFFYAKWGNSAPPGPGPNSPNGMSPSHVNYQVGSFYFELLLLPRLSAFAELRVQRTDMFFPNGGNTILIQNGGIGDTISGFKYAIYRSEYRYLTAQLKIYSPTGTASRGLGTDHTSVEPALLYISQWTDRAYFQGEIAHWIPIDGTNYAGNILRYGAGVGYDIYQSFDGQMPLNPYVAPGTRVTAVFETVAWSVLNGRFTPAGELGPAGEPVPDGFTVVNVKPGIRFTHNQGSLYAGAGFAVTGDRWYSDLFRIEYRRMF